MKTQLRSSLAIVLVVAIVAALIVSAALAAPNGNRQKPGAGIGFIERFGQELNLTDAQKTKIKAIMEEHRAEATKVRQSNLTQEQKQAKLADLRKDAQTKIDAVLTPEQRAKLKELRAARQERREELGQCLQSLGLTDAQKSQIQAIHKDTQTKVQAVRSNTNLTQQQKAEKIAAIRKATHEKVLAVLTPEQQQKLKECREAHQGGRGR